MIGVLLRAKANGEVLEMIYHSDKGKLSQRRVRIIEVYQDSIKAYCFLREMPRVFKFDNILSVGSSKKLRGA